MWYFGSNRPPVVLEGESDRNQLILKLSLLLDGCLDPIDFVPPTVRRSNRKYRQL